MSFLNLARDLYIEVFGKIKEGADKDIGYFEESLRKAYDSNGWAGIEWCEKQIRTSNIEQYVDQKFFIGKIVKGKLVPPTKEGFEGYTEKEIHIALSLIRNQYPRSHFIICRCVFKTDI